MLSIILATDLNGCIWKDNRLCWDLKKDLNFFSEKTRWQIVIMWKNTYLSLPEQSRPLSWRINFVVSKTLQDEKVKVFNNLENAIQQAKQLNKEIFLIWGKSIYEVWINIADIVYLTQIEEKFNCNVCLSKNFFSKLNQNFELNTKSNIFNENWIKFRFLKFIRK